MKWKIEKNVILEALNNVTKALSQRTTIPVLNGIVFDVNEKGMELLASDSELTIKVLIPNNDIKMIEGSGRIIIQSKYFIDMIRKMPSDVIDFEVEDNLKIKISTPNNQYRLNCYNPCDYPNILIDKSNDVININSEKLRELINQTSYALSTQEVRPLLTGINFRINNGELDVIATDSYRLARKLVAIDKVDESDINIVIPGKNLVELTKMLDNDEESLELHLFSNKVLFKYGNIVFLSRLLSGTYPTTSDIIPKNFNILLECSFNDLYNMIDRASLLTSDREKNTIKLSLKGNELMISSNSPEIGKVEEKINVENDKNIEISFSSKFMLDAIKSFNKEKIVLCMNNDSSPIVIKSNEDDSLVQLVLPIKTC